jgi:hypothetical protein
MVLYDVSLADRAADRDEAASELSAILAVGKALSTLQDPEARLRVLRWANERYNAPEAVEQAPSPVQLSAAATDNTLSMEGLDAFFQLAPGHHESSEPTRHEPADAPQAPPDEDIGDLFEEPVQQCRADLHVVARNDAPETAVDAELSDLYEARDHQQVEAHDAFSDLFDQEVVEGSNDADDHIVAFDDDPLEQAPADTAAVTAADQPLDALVSDFASACRLLSLQLQDATA